MMLAAEIGASSNALDAMLRNPILALFAILMLGMVLGNIQGWSVSLGTSGVLFVALAFGHLQYTIPARIGEIGLVLFAYGVGISAGPGFFRAFVSQGANLAKLSAIIVSVAALATLLCAWLCDIPKELAVGIFAGVMTSTPALAAAKDTLGAQGALASIGYGVAYPIGVVCIVLFVQVLPRLLRQNLDSLARQVEDSRGRRKIIMRVVAEVTNPAVVGRKLVDIDFVWRSGCQVVRVMEDDQMVPVTPDLVLQPNQLLLVVGTQENLDAVVDYLGRRSDRPFFMDADRERRQIVVTGPGVIGRTVRGLDPLRRFGVTISRVARRDVGFVPNADTVVQHSDVLTVVGEPANLDRFAQEAGHRAKAIDETDLASLALGITVGVILGMIPLALPGTRGFTLGLAGGPLFVGLLMGHFGHLGRISGVMPRAARIVLTELGLAFFLASAGVEAGGRFVEVVSQHGAILMIVGIIVKVVVLTVGYFVAAHLMRLNLLETLGGICGGVTSTPGLGAITSRTDSDIPVVSYATAYPVALILMTIGAQVLVSLVGWLTGG